MKIFILVFTLLAALIGSYFSYGIFASDLGQLISNKKDSGASTSSMVKFIWQELLDNFKSTK